MKPLTFADIITHPNATIETVEDTLAEVVPRFKPIEQSHVYRGKEPDKRYVTALVRMGYHPKQAREIAYAYEQYHNKSIQNVQSHQAPEPTITFHVKPRRNDDFGLFAFAEQYQN